MWSLEKPEQENLFWFNAFSFFLGARPREEWIRSKSDFAGVEGWFDISYSPLLQEKLEERGWSEEIKEGVVLSPRNKSKRESKARINGRVVSLTALKGVSSHLVDIYGQERAITSSLPRINWLFWILFWTRKENFAGKNTYFLRKKKKNREENWRIEKRTRKRDKRNRRNVGGSGKSRSNPSEKIEQIEEEFQRYSNAQKYQELIQEVILSHLRRRGKRRILALLRRVRGGYRRKR